MAKTYINWSSGKDACLALYKFQQSNSEKVSKLVTAVNSEENAVSMHGIPVELVKLQSQSLQIPLQFIEIPGTVKLESYSSIIEKSISGLQKEGFSQCIFGDIYLEDLRKYREQQLEPTGISPVFPLWKISSEKLIHEFIDLGFKAIVVCINSNLLNEDFCGRIIDHNFIKDLPEGVDTCGENGEFHSFVFDGPNFNFPIKFSVEEKYNVNLPASDDNSWETNFTYCKLSPK